ncbi:MAG: hypothetical protein LBJ36_02845 [Synergistaceae bacterium]|jgi:hypothetical protein|nr:hypothetical protein [Synergistaceae bacterium]
MKIKKIFVFLAVAVFCIGLMVRYTLRDIHLDVNLLREGLENMPGLLLENLEFEREISGDLWQVQIPWARRSENKIEVRSLDVRRQIADGGEWYLRSNQGVYSEEAASLDIGPLLGTLEMGPRVLNLESPRLFWSKDEDEFLFPKGLTIYDAEFLLKANVASLDVSGVVLLDRGGVIQWTSTD